MKLLRSFIIPFFAKGRWFLVNVTIELRKALKQKASVATIATSINKEAENKIPILGTALDSKVKRLSG